MMRHSPVAVLAVACCLLSSASARPLERDSLPNGLIIVTSEDHRLPVVDLSLVCRSGAAFDPPGKAGTANLVAQMLTRGTRTMTADSMAALIEYLGAELQGNADYDAASISLRLLAKDLATGLDIGAEAVLHPRFDTAEFAMLRGQMMAGARRRLDNPGAVVDDAFSRLLFGDHPYGRPASGDTSSVSMIAIADLVQFHQTFFRPNNCFLVAVGDFDRAVLRAEVEKRFGAWQPGAIPSPPPVSPVVPARTRVKLITRPDMNQTYVTFGHAGITALDLDLLSTRIMSYILGGGAMSSRLGLAVREEAGLAYDVRCYFDRRLLPGAFRASVQTARPKDAIEKMFTQVALMHDSGATSAELLKAHNYYTGSFPLTYSSNRGKLYSAHAVELYRHGIDWLEKFPERIRAVTLEQVNQAARERLFPGAYVMVIMGNVTREALGLTDVEWIE
jgi:zinc protease